MVNSIKFTVIKTSSTSLSTKNKRKTKETCLSTFSFNSLFNEHFV